MEAKAFAASVAVACGFVIHIDNVDMLLGHFNT
jgi:hypothetical protein